MRGETMTTCESRQSVAVEIDDCIKRGQLVEAFALLTDPRQPIAEGMLALDLLRLALQQREEVRA
jgi:hypothetical protein